MAERSISEQAACRHERGGWLVLPTANGVEQIRRGCLDCGFRSLRSHPHREHPERGSYPLLEPRRWDDRTGDYDLYRRSERWLERREAAKARCGQRCQLCGAVDEPLEVHHNTYKRLGSELETDLTVLCATCHGIFHDRRALAEQRGRQVREGSSLREVA